MSSPEQDAADSFRRCLLDLAKRHTQPPDPLVAQERLQQFREAMLLFGSESCDNSDCAEHLEIGTIPTNIGYTEFGLKLRDTDIGVANVLWHSEGCSIPEQVSKTYPELTQSQWEACQRLATLVLSAFQSQIESGSD